jgi:hypothetical protein
VNFSIAAADEKLRPDFSFKFQGKSVARSTDSERVEDVIDFHPLVSSDRSQDRNK